MLVGELVLACFWSHSSLPMHTAANMVRLVMYMVALDRIHSPNVMENTPYYTRRGKSTRWRLIYGEVCDV